MSLQQTIKDQMKEAMLNKEVLKLSVIRSLVAAFTNELIAKKKSASDILADEEVLDIIRRSVKQHKDSIEQFTNGGRKDLAKSESAELKILEAYLPQMMDVKEIKKNATAKQKALGITDKKDAGKLMSAVMKELKGKADGSDVKAVVDELLG
ncbi:MAG: GatB/YqeY domain-containing protein [Candidatus Paceibacterota bacterium]|jgi:hypothetical protein